MKKMLIPLLMATACALSFVCGIAHADEESERETLARISYELERLQQTVIEAGRDTPTAARVKFRYDWLARDLEMMRAGIDAHLDSPRQPRPVPPLKGDYRQ